MRTILAAALLSVLGAATATGEESPKLKVATVRLERISNSGLNYELLQFLSLDKETLESVKKVNDEIQNVQKEITDVEDEVKLADLGRKLEFLNRKLGMIRQRSMNNRPHRDMQMMIRDFVIGHFKGKYQLILQDTGMPDRLLWKGNAEFTDITDEAADELREHLDRMTGEKDGKESKEPGNGKEAPKFQVATVQMDRLMNSGANYEKIRMLLADKTTLDVLKKINADIQTLQKEIVDVEDETKLEELGRKLNFLYTKSNLLKPRVSINPVVDVQSLVRDFVNDKYQDKYPLILQQSMNESRPADRILWKGNVEFVDITDEVAEKFKEYLDQIPDQSTRPPLRKMKHNSKASLYVPLIKKSDMPPETEKSDGR